LYKPPPAVAKLLAQRAAATAAVYEEEDYPGYRPRVDHGNAGFVSHPCYN